MKKKNTRDKLKAGVRKRVFKLIKKNVYVAVIAFALTLCGGWSLVTLGIQTLAQEKARNSYNSITNDQIFNSRMADLEEKEKKLTELIKIYESKTNAVDAALAEQRSKARLLDDDLNLKMLIESLRRDFGLIEPGVQELSDIEYMKKYREHETTLKLAADIAKKLGKYEDYKRILQKQGGNVEFGNCKKLVAKLSAVEYMKNTLHKDNCICFET